MRIFIGYVSMSGNTEDIANILQDELHAKGCEVVSECLDTVDMEEIITFNGILIGSYTWGDGDLPYEAEDFYEELDDLKLDSIPVACFGSGDHAYPKFCAAVDTFAHKFKSCGAEVYNQTLKMEFGPETNEQELECREFAQTFYAWVKKTEGNIHHV
ncbi:flavodoxin [Sutcliffiella horikoshii]|uniref:Flavodoxin n=1 Tax=Sutcliffiella horikoshii TaxID=79883 RepID=A0A5D4SZH4_9BACI|nr:flavodoxin [Sutcliffiella horikoshii]TYS67424.1 flavodoxin [Sutcliffiella horikoshii]